MSSFVDHASSEAVDHAFSEATAQLTVCELDALRARIERERARLAVEEIVQVVLVHTGSRAAHIHIDLLDEPAFEDDPEWVVSHVVLSDETSVDPVKLTAINTRLSFACDFAMRQFDDVPHSTFTPYDRAVIDVCTSTIRSECLTATD